MITFEVIGEPIPKGSFKIKWFRRGRRGTSAPRIVNDNDRTEPWQDTVVRAVRALNLPRPLEGPVELWVMFYLTRPKSAPKKRREPEVKPDLDKLERALKDAMTRGGVYRDDAQVVCVVKRKAYAAGPRDPEGARGVARAVVRVREEG